MPPPPRTRRGHHAGRARRSLRLSEAPDPLPARRGRAQRLDPETRRALIIDAAERLLAEDDPLLITFDQVAQVAGVSRSLVHTYLGDRRGLIDSVQVRIVARLDAWVDHGLRRATDPDDALRAITTGLFAFVTAERDGWGVLVSSGGLDHPALHGVRARWASAAAGEGPDAEVAAQVALAALLGGVGGWINRGVDATDVWRQVRRLRASAVAGSDPERGRLDGGD